MRVREAVEEYLGAKSNSITEKTYRWYTYHLERFSSWCDEQGIEDISKVTPAHVQAAISTFPTKNSNSLHGYTQVIKGFLSWCAKDEEFGVRERTVKRIELPKVRVSKVEVFTDVEIERLLKSCVKLPYPHRNGALVHMLVDTGVRASELCYDGSRPGEETGLRMENLFLGRDDSYIRVMGKGRKPRSVGLGSETTQAMRRYLHRERGRSENPYVFLSRRDEPLSVRMLEQFLTDLGVVAGVSGVHPHRFRHTFAVNQLLHGTSDLVLMRLMGHTSLEATKIYTRAMSELQARQAAPSDMDRIKKKSK